MARRSRSMTRDALRRLAQFVIVIAAFYAFLGFMSSDVAKSTMTALSHQMLSGLGAPTAAPPSGNAWTAADGQACHAAYDAVSDWPGKSATSPIDVVVYSGSSDVKAARQACPDGGEDVPRDVGGVTVSLRLHSDRRLPVTSLSDLATAAALSMTVPDFRTKYQRTIDTLSGIRTRCTAIDQWVQDHVAQ